MARAAESQAWSEYGLVGTAVAAGSAALNGALDVRHTRSKSGSRLLVPYILAVTHATRK